MLRRSVPLLWQNPQVGPAIVNLRCRNKDLTKAIIRAKERKKFVRYYGTWLQRQPDRELWYANFGGVRNTRLIVRRVISKCQYVHGTAQLESWGIRNFRKFPQLWDACGAGIIGFQVWDSSSYFTDTFLDGFFKFYKYAQKDNAVAFAECFGLKMIVLDEMVQPFHTDFVYYKHKLYAHNFPWIAEPITGVHIGDADWFWRGDDVIDYTNYGASTKSKYNYFRPSLFEAQRKFKAPELVASSKKKETKKAKDEKPVPKADTPPPSDATPAAAAA